MPARSRELLGICLAGVIAVATPAIADDAAAAWSGRIIERGGVEQIWNPATPAGAPREYILVPLWSTGADPRDELIGRLGGVAVAADGSSYLLDEQMSVVRIYDSDGHLRSVIGRAGEGPGEIGRPGAVLALGDDLVGIADFSPGRIIRLQSDGIPAGDLTLESVSPEGTRLFLQAAATAANRIVLETRTGRRSETGIVSVLQLLAVDLSGALLCRYLDREWTLDPAHRTISDREETFDRGRWALSPDGRVHVVLERDAFHLGLYDPDGRLVREIFREGTASVPRDPAELERLSARVRVGGRRGSGRGEIDLDFAPHRPEILALWPGPEGELWVRIANHDKQLPSGVQERLELYGPGGRWLCKARMCDAAPLPPGDCHYVQDRLFRFESAGDTDLGSEEELGDWDLADAEWDDPGFSGAPLSRVTCYQLIPRP